MRLLLALIGIKSRLTAAIFTIFFFIDSQSNYPDPDASTASRLHQMLLQLLQTSHTTWGHRYSNVLNFSWNVCYIQDSNVKFFGGRAGGRGEGSIGCFLVLWKPLSVWVLFTFFSIFCIKSFGDWSRPNDPHLPLP